MSDSWNDEAKQLVQDQHKYPISPFDDNNNIAYALKNGSSPNDLPQYFKEVIVQRSPEEREFILNKIVSLSTEPLNAEVAKVLTCKNLGLQSGHFIINDPTPVSVVEQMPVATLEFDYSAFLPPPYDAVLEEDRALVAGEVKDPGFGYTRYFPDPK